MTMQARNWIVHFPRGTGWASRLLAAHDEGRIDAPLLWELLLAHVDAATEPDVAALLEHLPDPDAAPARVRGPSEEFVLVDDTVGAA